MMKWLRAVGELLYIFLIALILITKISQSWDYWWIALGISLFLLLPTFVELFQKAANQKEASREEVSRE